jgi:hypothetical protein
MFILSLGGGRDAMFDVFIISRIIEEEERRRRQENERPRLEVPQPLDPWPEDQAADDGREERGVVIIGDDEA